MIASPCINICQMDPASGLCRGCLRTLDEITRWSRIDDAERQGILDAVSERRQAVRQTRLFSDHGPHHD